MNKINVAILYGGKSGEHEVSLRSASSVEKNLDKSKYNIHLIGITRTGLWYYQQNYNNDTDSLSIVEDDDNLVSLTPGRGFHVKGSSLNISFIFPILHGTFGEDGTLQGMLDLVGIPYAGSGLEGSFMAMDKEYAKIIWQKEGLPIVPYISIKKYSYKSNPQYYINCIESKFQYPVFVKPVKTGSSVGVSKASSREKLETAITNAFMYDHKILIEKSVNAREVECSVIGNDEPITFPLGEIAPSHEFYDYDAKYTDPDGAKLIIPAVLDSTTATKIQDIAKKAYSALNIKGFSRVDFFIDKDTDEISLNEINTIPGFTKISMFSMLCREGGLNFPELLDKIYNYGIEKYKEEQTLKYN